MSYFAFHWELVSPPECEAHNVHTEYSNKYKDYYCCTEEQLRHLERSSNNSD